VDPLCTLTEMDSSSPGIRYPAVVDRVYTEALVSEIVSGKLKIEGEKVMLAEAKRIILKPLPPARCCPWSNSGFYL